MHTTISPLHFVSPVAMKPLLHRHFVRFEVFHSPLLWHKAYDPDTTEFSTQLPLTLMTSKTKSGANVLGSFMRKADNSTEGQTVHDTRKDHTTAHAARSWRARKTYDSLSFIATDKITVFLGSLADLPSHKSVAVTLPIFLYPVGGKGHLSLDMFVVVWCTYKSRSCLQFGFVPLMLAQRIIVTWTLTSILLASVTLMASLLSQLLGSGVCTSHTE